MIVLVHEDQPKPDGIPTEVVGYSWTRKRAEKRKKLLWKNQPRGKWMLVFDNSWKQWWTFNAGTVYEYQEFDTVYEYQEFDKETATFKRRKIAWWRRERLWRALWRLIRRKSG